MLGVATGLAEAGFVPFVYSIATFATSGPYEFVRNGPVLHRLPVRIVGVGGGLEYGMNGLTHYALEDIAVMRTQPGMTVLAPADFEQARTALMESRTLPGPIYFRLGKNETETVPELDGRFRLGGVEQIGNGRDVAIVATGSIAHEAAAAVEPPRDPGVALAPRRRRVPEPVAGEGPRHLAAQRLARGHCGGALPVRRARLARLRGRRRVGPRMPRRPLRRREPSRTRSGSEAFLNEAHGLSASRDRASRRGRARPAAARPRTPSLAR